MKAGEWPRGGRSVSSRDGQSRALRRLRPPGGTKNLGSPAGATAGCLRARRTLRSRSRTRAGSGQNHALGTGGRHRADRVSPRALAGRTGGRPTMRRPSYPAAPAELRPPVGRGLPAGGRLAVTGACGKARWQQVTQDGILAGLEQAQDPRGRPLEWANEPPRAKRAGRFVRPYRAPCAISRRRARTRRRVGRRGEPVAPPERIEGWGRRS